MSERTENGFSISDLRSPRRSAAIVAVGYALFAAAWWVFSGPAVRGVAPSPEAAASLQEWERWIFLALSALVLFALVSLELGRRTRAIRSLAAAHDRLSRQVDRSPLALVEWDENLRVRRWSRNAEVLFGWSGAEAEGRSWMDWELVHPDERPALGRFLDGLGSRAPGGAVLVQRNQHRTGEVIWCEWYVSWLRDARGELRSVLALVNDITPDREAMSRMQERNRDLEVRIAVRTRELAAARRDLRAFTNSLANDLRAPVRAVIEFSESLRDSVGDQLPSEARRELVYLMAAGRQLDHLIADLLEYATLGTREAQRKPVELVQTARRVIRDLEDRFPEADSVISLPRSAVTLLADPELLERVLRSLFENALQYRDPHRPPRVTIHVGWTESEVKVRIQDNGTGIPPEHRERVFRLFERLHSRESHPGSGMGLAIVRKAMDLMGGAVSIEEQGGPGTSFLLRFPTGRDAASLEGASDASIPGQPTTAPRDAEASERPGSSGTAAPDAPPGRPSKAPTKPTGTSTDHPPAGPPDAADGPRADTDRSDNDSEASTLRP